MSCQCPDCRRDHPDPLVRFARWLAEMRYHQDDIAHPQRVLRGISFRASEALEAHEQQRRRGQFWNDRGRRAPL